MHVLHFRIFNFLKCNINVNGIYLLLQKMNDRIISLKAHRLSGLKVANIRCFILIKCSEQNIRFNKSVIMSELVKRIRMYSIGRVNIEFFPG
jgi:hypothetical protein